MQDSQDTIAVIGTGVIGTGWIIRFLFNKKKVKVFDPTYYVVLSLFRRSAGKHHRGGGGRKRH